MYKYINKILVILSYVVNTFPPLLQNDLIDQDFENFLGEFEDMDPNEAEFIMNDQFIANYDENDDENWN